MLSESRFSKTVIDVDNRSFTVQVLLFENGSFVSITEGQEKIGGFTASIGTGSVPVTTSIIPAKSESLFLKLISEQLSSIISGINIISTFIPKELENKTAKILIEKIKEGINEYYKNDGIKLTMSQVLQGGTWAAGRVIAQERRKTSKPPLTIRSDGTVF